MPMRPTKHDVAGPCCPACGSADVVRVFGSPRILRRPKARCARCAHRFRVTQAVFSQLREPELAELRRASWTERLGYMFEARMTTGQVVVTVAGGVLGTAIALWLDKSLFAFLGLLVFWWIGRLLFPKP